ncbi:GW dipeptide domain-containing protein [Candidatus Sulfurimonas baltica]|uniref:SH3-like domain-containing protein n=1 Tax=Candidatus Sulfurimonas baltica TaxID=2740404 RepID=A0A7S7LV16_9BACT|nr:GW dipeptide domain-containing protein [Candidatus Sulfurimonas baltica]QOY51860.1 SH3-like domain-containing protein [Candidatus Sulfurimonas baltica]
MKKISIALSVATLLIVGCSDKPKEQEKSAPTETTKAAVEPQSIYGASPQKQETPSDNELKLDAPHVAKVLETVDGGGYTYAKVEEEGNIYWIAGPQTEVTVGSKISFLEQMVMNDFASKALNKTFDTLVFVSAIVSTDKSAKSGAAVATAAKHTDGTHIDCNHDDELKKAPSEIKVSKNPNGYSVEDLYAKKAELAAKSVKVNAQVVKVSKGIMGKDWIHIQDGSGSNGTNDIIATSKNSTVKVGDVVTTEGVIKTNVDLGYGYKFSVIIEDAKFTSIK